MTARDRTVIVVVLCLAAIVGSWLMLVQPKRSQASRLGDQVKAAQAKLDSARSELAADQAARSSFASSYATLVKLGAAVPADDNVPSLIYQLQAAANASQVDFRDLSLVPGGSSAPVSTGPAAATQAATAALPPGASVGPAGFPVEPFTFTFNGNFFHLADFLGRVERFVVANNKGVAVSGRLMTLNAISLGAGPKGFPQITASISANTYLIPAAQGLSAGATPAGPGSGTPVAASGSSSSTAATAAVASPVK
jgi:type II secretory pathway pseudopilin PulG